MRRLLLSSAVVVAAILAPTAATYGPQIVQNTSSHYDYQPIASVPGLPVIQNGKVVPPVVPATGSFSAPSGNSVSTANHATLPAGTSGSSSHVIDGATSTPAPGTCSGASMSKASSDNGQRTRERHSMNNCGEDGTDNCEDPCNS